MSGRILKPRTESGQLPQMDWMSVIGCHWLLQSGLTRRWSEYEYCEYWWLRWPLQGKILHVQRLLPLKHVEPIKDTFYDQEFSIAMFVLCALCGLPSLSWRQRAAVWPMTETLVSLTMLLESWFQRIKYALHCVKDLDTDTCLNLEVMMAKRALKFSHTHTH